MLSNGGPIKETFNGPFMPSFLRRNKVIVPVYEQTICVHLRVWNGRGKFGR